MSKKVPQIQEVMSALPHSIGLNQNLKTAREMMAELGVRHLPVQSGGRLCGIVSDRDIDFGLAVDLKHDTELRVEDVYTAEPFTVEPDTSLDKVVEQMAAQQLGSALIAEGDQLVGIYTATDACKTLCQLLRSE